MPETIDKRLRRNGLLGVETVVVYGPDDALPEHAVPVPWREAMRGGQYAWSDDGFALPVFRVNGPYRHNTTGAMRREVVTVAGVSWTDSRQQLLWEREREWARRTLSLTQRRSWSAIEAGKARTKRAVAAAAEMVLSGRGIDYEAVGVIYRPDEKQPAATAYRLLKQPEIKAMLTEEVAKHFRAHGFSADSVPETIKKAVEAAVAKNDARTLLEIARELEAYFPSKPTDDQTDPYEQDVPPFAYEMLAEIRAERPPLPAARRDLPAPSEDDR